MTIEEARKLAIIPRRKKFSTVDWLMMSTEEVLERFASLPGAERYGTPGEEEQFIYIPGTRKDKVLLVAHSDTVHSKATKIAYYKDQYFSAIPDNGIGADDRAGCNILWKLRNLGHSLLIPNAEEKGCKGSRYLMRGKGWPELIASHNFVLQFDRRNSSDLVSYSVGSHEFSTFLEKEMKGYKRTQGSYTDICVLCDDSKHENDKAPCAVNISIGYYNEHTSTESLNIRQWNRTLSRVYELLSKENLPSFKQKSYRYSSHHSGRTWDDDDYTNQCAYSNAAKSTYKDNKSKEESITNIIEEIFVCPHCDFIALIEEVKENNNQCPCCKKDIK